MKKGDQHLQTLHLDIKPVYENEQARTPTRNEKASRPMRRYYDSKEVKKTKAPGHVASSRSKQQTKTDGLLVVALALLL